MRKLPCTIDGIEYESKSAAAKALKIDAGTVRTRLRSSNFLEYISKHHPKKKRRKGVYSRKPRDYRRCPCTIKGIRYETESVAASTLRIGMQVLRNRLHSSNFPGYTSKYRPKIQRKKARIRCTIKGIEYASITEAAKKLKINASTLTNRLESFNYPDHVSADILKKTPKPLKYSYTVNGKKYRTLQEIADVERVTRERIRQKMNDTSYREYKRFKRKPSRNR